MSETTKLLYMTNSYQRKCVAVVKSVKEKNGNAEIILSETIFYPQGGGQPSDQGIIKGKNGELKVTNVTYNNGNPIHQGKLKGELKEGDKANCVVDWNRRYKNMRVHSAGHLVHEAVNEAVAQLKPVKGQHGIGGEQFIEYEGEAILGKISLNMRLAQLINEKRAVKTYFVTLDELKKKAQFIPENLPKNKPLRVMEIDGFQPVPDGGTQVKSTGELEGTSVTDIETANGAIKVHYRISIKTPAPTTKAKKTAGKKIGEFKSDSTEIMSQESFLAIKNNALALITGAGGKEELEELRVKYLGRKGEINRLFESVVNLPHAQKRTRGKILNETKTVIEQTLAAQMQALSSTPIKQEFFDPTVPGKKPPLGSLHPITKITNEVEDIFRRFGFSVASGPEVEWDEINFQKLLMGPDHPSRDTQETYYFDNQRLLRVHTSSVQIRYMETHQPPIRIIVPGRVYRRDNIDATHLPSFYQIEGLLVDDRTTLTDLLGILEHTAKQLFGQEKKVRFYGHNFPYTEPSLEVEVQNEKGQWLEILGCGIVHPQVLENCGIDSNKFQGWAFGMGADRLAMLKYGITDIRQLYGGNLKFLAG